MLKRENNYAFIDSQNVNLSIQRLGWRLDFARFRVHLREKYSVQKAYVFIGFVEANQDLYKSLQEAGFILIFKPTLPRPDGTVKGNCDAELVLQAMIDYDHYDQAVIVTGDGDFACLVKYLAGQGKLKTVLVPNRLAYSALIKRTAGKRINFMNELQGKLEHKKKRTP